MADAALLEDLGLVILWGGAFILATLAYYIVKPIADALDVSILGLHPFRGIGQALENSIVSPLNDLRGKSDAQIAKGLSGLVDDVATLLGVFLILGLGVKAALSYLWHHALGPFVHAITDTIRAVATESLARVKQLERDVRSDVVLLSNLAVTEAQQALDKARSYADTVSATAEHAAERYADDAVAKLREAEDKAVANAVRLANDAKAAGEAAATTALRTAEGEIKSARTAAEAEARSATATAEAEASRALAASEAAARTALQQVKAIAVGAEGDLTDFEQYVKSLGLPAVIAGSTALATLVTVVLTETGLENQACRGKVKQICGTNPAAWTGLLEGLAAVGFAFSLADLAAVAEPLAGDIAGLLAQAA